MKKWLLIFCVVINNPFVYAVNNGIICSGVAKDPKTIQSINWYRNSAEQMVLYREIFSLGQNYIIKQVKQQHLKPKKWGIILDIDETTLDNSFYFRNCGELANNEDDFSKYVVLKELSIALPSVTNLTCSIKNMGGYVSMVSNRDGSYTGVLTATINNLTRQGICFDQVVLANNKQAIDPTDKNLRFNAVENGAYDSMQMVLSNKLPKHKIIAYFGDNIQDFPHLKQKKVVNYSSDNSIFNKFGNGYFLLPNPMYGSWQTNPDK